MNKRLGHFVDTRVSSGCAHDRNVAAARAAVEGIGEPITRAEGLRRVNAEQAASLRARNFMSPDIIAVLAMAGATGMGPVVVEVAAGEFMGDTIYGVSVYHTLPGERARDWDASKAVTTIEDLVKELRSLNGEDD